MGGASMARIFVSYSRADRPFVENFVPLLRRVYGLDSVWYDDQIHGGADWWRMILDKVEDCQLFVYLISNESLASPYCLAEFREALRLQKAILPIIVRPRTHYPGEIADDLREVLQRIQYVDMSSGFKDSGTLAELYAAVHQLFQIGTASSETQETNHPEGTNRSCWFSVTSAVLGGALLIVLYIIFGPLSIGGKGVPGGPPSETNFAGVSTKTPSVLPIATVAASATLTDTPTQVTPSPVPSMTATTPPPSNTSPPEPSLTPDYSSATPEEALFQEANVAGGQPVTTISFPLSATAPPTLTPVPVAVEIQARPGGFCFRSAPPSFEESSPIGCREYSEDERFKVVAVVEDIDDEYWYEIETTWIDGVDTAWVPERQVELYAGGNPVIPILANTHIPPTPQPVTMALERARGFSGSNNDWTPFVKEFDGVEMALVPVGCFMMGSTKEQAEAAFKDCLEGWDDCRQSYFEREIPAHEVCFETPFWIDRYEVTNAQFERFDGKAQLNGEWSEPNRPREKIAWYEARDFCESRGARLPTEAEWEYAARGPANWQFPWGNDFAANFVVFWVNSDDETAEVGSNPRGASWVGADDMSGNVWEWVDAVFSLYSENPQATPSDSVDMQTRVVRGGSFYQYVPAILRAPFRLETWNQSSRLTGFRCARSADN